MTVTPNVAGEALARGVAAQVSFGLSGFRNLGFVGPHLSCCCLAGAAVVSAARRDVRMRIEGCMMMTGVEWNENENENWIQEASARGRCI